MPSFVDTGVWFAPVSHFSPILPRALLTWQSAVI
jgi:hypothetical protein